MRMLRFGVTPRIHVGLHHSARIINIVTIDAGPIIFVLTDNLKATNGRAVSFATTRYPRRCTPIRSTIEIGFLGPQADDDRRPPGMCLREVRCDHVSHCATPAETHEGRA